MPGVNRLLVKTGNRQKMSLRCSMMNMPISACRGTFQSGIIITIQNQGLKRI